MIDNYLKTRKTILVFDNFEDVQKSDEGEQQQAIGSASLAEFMTYLCENTPINCHLLFTTRYKIVDLAEQLTHIALDKMTYAEQYRLTNFSETLRKIPMSERQDIVKRLDGHPRGYEFLETLLKKDKMLTWTELSTQIGEVEAKVCEDLLLEKIYQRLNPEEQQLLQVCAVFISRTPIEALNYVIEKAEIKVGKIELERLLGLCYYDSENQILEVHRLTREWMIENIIANEKLKEWAFLTGVYLVKENMVLIQDAELARNYFTMSEAWDRFVKISFDLQQHYGTVGLYKRVYELNHEIFNMNLDKDSTAAALNNIGHMLLSNLRTKDDLEDALNYFIKSLEAQKDLKNFVAVGIILSNISKVYEIKGDYKEAMNYLTQSLASHKKYDYKYGQAITLDKICQIHLLNVHHQEAYNFAKESLKIYQEINDSRGISGALNNLGMSFLLKKNIVKV